MNFDIKKTIVQSVLILVITFAIFPDIVL
jgi:hypothetical protein